MKIRNENLYIKRKLIGSVAFLCNLLVFMCRAFYAAKNNSIRYVVIPITLILLLLSNASFAQDFTVPDLSNQSFSTEYSYPVDFASHVITNYGEFWNPVGNFFLVKKYTLGRSLATGELGYVLLASPKLTLNLIIGGVYSVAATVSIDFVLGLIEQSVGSPRQLCFDVSAAVNQEGLDEYEIAYTIARKYITEGSITPEEAMVFLDNRWGIWKLVYSESLYNRANSGSYTISSAAQDAAVEELTNMFFTNYQHSLGISNTFPVLSYGNFIKDLFTILENRNVGLLDYQPYLNFAINMEELNNLRLIERERFLSLLISNEEEVQVGFVTATTRRSDLEEIFPHCSIEDVVSTQSWGYTWGSTRIRSQGQPIMLIHWHNTVDDTINIYSSTIDRIEIFSTSYFLADGVRIGMTFLEFRDIIQHDFDIWLLQDGGYCGTTRGCYENKIDIQFETSRITPSEGYGSSTDPEWRRYNPEITSIHVNM